MPVPVVIVSHATALRPVLPATRLSTPINRFLTAFYSARAPLHS